jgi:hypothetical protein
MRNSYLNGSENPFNEEVLDIPKLNLNFLLRGIPNDPFRKNPFNAISVYHRHILYLYYGLDYDIRETANTLNRDKDTIQTEIKWILKRLRDFWRD